MPELVDYEHDRRGLEADVAAVDQLLLLAPPGEPVASACKFESEKSTLFSLRAPVIAWFAPTRGLGADATTSSSSPPPPNGLASLCANKFDISRS